MNKPVDENDVGTGDTVYDTAHSDPGKFWRQENLRFVEPHFRLIKAVRIIRKLAQGRESTLLDVGCGPATLGRLLPSNIDYYGIDIAIQDPAPNLREVDLREAPIKFGTKRFDIVLAQGIFEYVGGTQSRKFAEIAEILKEDGKFIVSYWNFGHRNPDMYHAFSNVQPFDDFRKALSQYFKIDKFFPASHNWRHTGPNRRITRAVNMPMKINIPLVSPILAVEYFFICSPIRQR
jgi:SAM-dependent methyltransferase